MAVIRSAPFMPSLMEFLRGILKSTQTSRLTSLRDCLRSPADPLVMRFCTIPGDILDDSVSVPRGLATKVIGAEGERLEGSERDVTQDFVLNNGPAFGFSNPRTFRSRVSCSGSSSR